MLFLEYIYLKKTRNISQNFDQLLFWISQLDYKICKRNVFKILFMFGQIVGVKLCKFNVLDNTTQLALDVLIGPPIA